MNRQVLSLSGSNAYRSVEEGDHPRENPIHSSSNAFENLAEWNIDVIPDLSHV
jgi:hypothetical protein